MFVFTYDQKKEFAMKILVLNGSPKGDLSVTLQYAHYLQKVNPAVEFQTYNIAQLIHKIEKDALFFDEIIEQVKQADGILWAFPLYILVVHAHYKRFIELIFERGVQGAFADKYAATLSTSIHYFDHTAHNYMHGICDDLGMRFVEAFSFDMVDLLEEKGRQQVEQLGHHFLEAIQTHRPYQRRYPALQPRVFTYESGLAPATGQTNSKKVVILFDGDRPGSNIAAMVARCRANFSGDVSVINLNEINIKASCQGCLKCGASYHCSFEGKDSFIDFYRSQVMTADILIYAGTIVDRYLSARWKTFFDRSFFNTHTPKLTEKKVAFVFSGPYSQLPNLNEILMGYTEFQMAHMVGLVSDEYGSSSEIDALIDQLMQTTLNQAVENSTRPITFLGMGGLKIFRDDVWGRIRMVFPADHHAYKQLGLYRTFPQHDLRQRLLNLIILPLLSIPKIREMFNKQMLQEMVKPLQQVVNKAR
jgi:multimeric flavodoxin WrbA